MRNEEAGILVNNKFYIPVGRAADLTGYHGDYVGHLCREKKIDGIKIGNNWLVSQEDILNLSSKNGSKNGKGKNIAFPTSTITPIKNSHDEWDKALFNDLPVERPSINKNIKIKNNKDIKNIASPTFKINYSFLFIIFLIGFFFYRHPESIYADLKDFQNFSAEVSNQTSQFFKQTSEQAVEITKITSSVILSDLKTAGSFGVFGLQSFENSVLNSGKLAGWLIRRQGETVVQNISQSGFALQDFGKSVGQKISQNKEIFKSTKTLFNSVLQKLSGLPEVQQEETQPRQEPFQTPKALSLSEELDRLKGQGFESQVSPPPWNKPKLKQQQFPKQLKERLKEWYRA